MYAGLSLRLGERVGVAGERAGMIPSRQCRSDGDFSGAFGSGRSTRVTRVVWIMGDL